MFSLHNFPARSLFYPVQHCSAGNDHTMERPRQTLAKQVTLTKIWVEVWARKKEIESLWGICSAAKNRS